MCLLRLPILRHLLPALGLGLLPAPAQAQLAPDSARLVLKLGIAPLVSNAYEAAAEFRSGQWFGVELAPRLIAGTVPASASTAGNEAGDQVRGFGLRFGPRFYLPNTGADGARLAGLYLGLRAEYQNLRLTAQRDAWGEELAADGLRYYVYRSRDFSETIRRMGGAATLGYQSQLFHPRLHLDVSASYNRLTSTSSLGADSRYLSSRSDYGYSGGFWNLGFSLGFVVR